MLQHTIGVSMRSLVIPSYQCECQYFRSNRSRYHAYLRWYLLLGHQFDTVARILFYKRCPGQPKKLTFMWSWEHAQFTLTGASAHNLPSYMLSLVISSLWLTEQLGCDTDESKCCHLVTVRCSLNLHASRNSKDDLINDDLNWRPPIDALIIATKISQKIGLAVMMKNITLDTRKHTSDQSYNVT